MAKNYASKVISIASAEVGYLEKRTNSNLYDKEKNAGSNNYTKYAYEFDTKYPNFYNGKKNGYAWCDIFVDWCLVKAFGVDTALELLGQPFKSCGAGCSWSVRYYEKIKCFYQSSPKVGDQIFFKDSKGEPCHTGLVYKVDGKKVYTIEGNTSHVSGVVANGGAVAKKSYSLSYSRIYGYGRPKYDDEPKKVTVTVTPVTSKKTYSGTFPKLPTRGYFQNGDKGLQVKYLQKFLNWYGSYKLDVDGELGVKTISVVKKFQKRVKVTADGYFGKNTLLKAKSVKK